MKFPSAAIGTVALIGAISVANQSHGQPAPDAPAPPTLVCTEANIKECRQAIGKKLNSAKTAQEAKEVLVLAEQICQGVNPAACSELGDEVLFGSTTEDEVIKQLIDGTARKLYESSCFKGIPSDCSSLGALLLGELSTITDLDGAKRAFSVGCDANDGSSCLQLAEMQNDPTRRIEFLEKSCRINFASACISLDKTYTEGKLTAPNVQKAEFYKMRVCEIMKDARCSNAGQYFQDKDDYDSAAKAFSLACDRGAGSACGRLGMVLYSPEHKKYQREEARAAFKKGCASGDKFSCEKADSFERLIEAEDGARDILKDAISKSKAKVEALREERDKLLRERDALGR